LGGTNRFVGTVYSNNTLSQNIQVRFSGWYDIKAVVGKSTGSISDFENNTFYLYNINASVSLFNQVSLQYTDILGQSFNSHE
jgi:hypothetical protein